MTLVSAILPTYNRAEYVAGAIETALSQSHEEMEVVVVDDGSTDGTREELAAFEDDDRVSVYYNEENQGISASMNRAAENANGEFVCVLNDDDRWDPEKVTKQLARFEELGPEYGVVYTGGVVRRNGRTVRVYDPGPEGDIYPDVLAGFALHPHSGHMLRAECFDLGGYDPAFSRGVDWDHCIRLAKEYQFAYVNERLVQRIFHSDNISQEPIQGVEITGMIWEKYNEEIRAHPDIERRFLEGRERACATYALQSGHHWAAFRHAYRAFGYERTAESVFIMLFSILGTNALSIAQRVRDRLVDWRVSRQG